MTTPSDDQIIFSKRRTKLINALPKDGMAIIPAATQYMRNGDVAYPFRQSSHLMHLTDYPHPHALLVLLPGESKKESWFFCAAYDPLKARWEGLDWDLHDVKTQFGFDHVLNIDDVYEKIITCAANRRMIYAPLDNQHIKELMTHLDKHRKKKHREGITLPTQWSELGDLLDEERLIKDDAAIKCIQKACDITVDAHKMIMRYAKPGLFGYQVKAKLIEHFFQNGASGEAYPSIVAPGHEACILHHQDNNAILHENTLLLVDAGAEYQGYAADVTRTFPIAGRFTDAQKQIYLLVLEAQQRVIDAIKPGVSWASLDRLAAETLTEGLIRLGLLSGSVEKALASGQYRRFYMHKFGHWLGLDVHDVGAYTQHNASRTLEPGMVFTVEPGLYIDHNEPDVDPRWQGIGVRIEDNILVTDSGATVLTAALPRDVDGIESITAR
jgi:Xaa-Pro aminopeptidase